MAVADIGGIEKIRAVWGGSRSLPAFLTGPDTPLFDYFSVPWYDISRVVGMVEWQTQRT